MKQFSILAFAKTHFINEGINSKFSQSQNNGVVKFQHFSTSLMVCFRKLGMATPILFYNN